LASVNRPCCQMPDILLPTRTLHDGVAI